jgi:riboflavin biosynthesis pyrimidine reductase
LAPFFCTILVKLDLLDFSMQTIVVLGMSADGKIADGARSPARFGSTADKQHLERQVAAADAVLFGAGTLRSYGTTLSVSSSVLREQRQQAGKPLQPVQVVCSPSGRLDPQWRFFQQAVPRWLLTTTAGAKLWQSDGSNVTNFEINNSDSGDSEGRNSDGRNSDGKYADGKYADEKYADGNSPDAKNFDIRHIRHIRHIRQADAKISDAKQPAAQVFDDDSSKKSADAKKSSAKRPDEKNAAAKHADAGHFDIKKSDANSPAFERILTAGVYEDGIDWDQVFECFAAAGWQRLAVLGGGQLVASLVEAGRVDEIYLTVCPLLLGGEEAPSPVAGSGWLEAQAPRLELLAADVQGQEVFLHYRLRH